MSKYYTPRKTRYLYDPNSSEIFRLSRSKIDLYLNCPRCFYLDRRLGITSPPGFPFSLNSAVDKLLKKEFDLHRAQSQSHPLMKTYEVDAVPYQNEKLAIWRDPFKGIDFLHTETNLLVFGAIDDVWINPFGELHIVDYKATAKEEEVNLDADWQIGYKRQMEIYQWLFMKNKYKVSDTGYFVYCNGDTNKKAFDRKLEFRVKIIPYKGNSDWVEDILKQIHECLKQETIPEMSLDCDFCRYVAELKKLY